jgi:phage terminase large subunit
MSSTQNVERVEPFTPSPTQKAFIQCTDKQVLLSGSFGAGKSRVGCEKGFIMNCKYPGNRGLIIRDAFTDVRASTIEQTLLEEVIPDSHIANHNKSSHKIEHFTGSRGPNGEPILSEIQYHGLDKGKNSDGLPTKIGGQQYGWIFVDEGIEISKEAWIQLLGRLRFNGRTIGGKRYKVPFRQIYTATNPASKTHWMYDWFFVKEKGTWFKMTAKELAAYVDSIPQDYVDTMAQNYTGMYYDRYVEGEWVSSEGLVYNEYDSHTHIKQPAELPWEGWEVEKRVDHGDYTSVFTVPPSDWKVYRAIDFGFKNPFVCQWFAFDPDTRAHVLFRELYKTEELMEDLAEEIKQYSAGMKIEETYADPAQAEDRATLQRHGVESTEAKKDISAGIQEVKGKLNTKGDGPELFFIDGSLVHVPDQRLDDDNAPTKTVDEITEYQWKDEKDEPEQEHDHAMDALRYYIYSTVQGSSYSREEMEELEEIFNEGF